jgi:hypothetical protein
MNRTLCTLTLVAMYTVFSRLLTGLSSHSNQKHSPLLRLPAELRNAIYQCVFDDCQQIRFVDGRRSFIVCRNASTKTPAVWRHPWNLLTLTESCRQLYHETRMLPFENGEFFGYMKRMNLALSEYLTREQINAISRVRLMVDKEDVLGRPYSLLVWYDVAGHLAEAEGLKRIVMAHVGPATLVGWEMCLEAIEEMMRVCLKRKGADPSVRLEVEHGA